MSATISLVKGNIDDICQCFEDGLGGCWNDWLADHCCCCLECQFSCAFSCAFKSKCCCNKNDPCIGECTCPTSNTPAITQNIPKTSKLRIKLVRRKSLEESVNLQPIVFKKQFKVF